jgi:hypothetical protein
MMTNESHDKQEMSQAVSAVYQVLFVELRSAKRQQWTIKNYVLLTLAAIYGLASVLKETLTACEKLIATQLAILAVGFCLFFFSS